MLNAISGQHRNGSMSDGVNNSDTNMRRI